MNLKRIFSIFIICSVSMLSCVNQSSIQTNHPLDTNDNSIDQATATYSDQTISPEAPTVKSMIVSSIENYSIYRENIFSLYFPKTHTIKHIHIDGSIEKFQLNGNFVGFINKECEYYSYNRIDSSGFTLQYFDYFTGTYRDGPSMQLNNHDITLTYPTVSPNGKHASFVIWEGEGGISGGEYNNMAFVDVNDPSIITYVTKNGGSWERGGVWNSNGTSLLYTDFIDAGDLEVRLFDLVTGTSSSLTSLGNYDRDRIRNLSFSPDDQFGMIIGFNESGEQDILLFSIESNWIKEISLKPYGPSQRFLWAEDSESILFEIYDSESYEIFLIKLDLNTGEVTNEWPPEFFKESDFQMLGFSISGVRLFTIFLDNYLSIFDAEKGIVYPWISFEDLSLQDDGDFIFIASFIQEGSECQ